MIVRIKKIIAAFLTMLLLSSFFTKISALEDEQRQINEQTAIERMIQGFEVFADSIDISDLNISPSSLSMLFSHATKNSPYLFYVDKKLTYTYREGGDVIKILPKYNMTEEEAEKSIEFCKSEVKKMADFALLGNNELQRLLLAHDLICTRYTYDLTLESNNIYKFIKEGKGTCQGYTWTYMAVLRELGIECEYVASDSIEHIWLKVKIDGEWYHSDVTWDDPVGSETENTAVSRRHILFSDAKAGKDGYKDRYSVIQNKCTSEKYDKIDLSSELSPNHTSGDVNHDGRTDLFDLVIILKNNAPCPICSDIDKDMCLTENDVEKLREVLLTN